MTTSIETDSKILELMEEQNLESESRLCDLGEFVGACVDQGMIRPKPIFNTVYVETCGDSYLVNRPRIWKGRIQDRSKEPLLAQDLVAGAHIGPDATIRILGAFLNLGMELGIHRPFLLDSIWLIGLDTELRGQNKLAGYRRRFG